MVISALAHARCFARRATPVGRCNGGIFAAHCYAHRSWRWSRAYYATDIPSPQTAAHLPQPHRAERPKPKLVGHKAVLTLTPEAVERIHVLLSGPRPQLLRIGVRNKGCAGMSYHLEYVNEPSKFDEVVEQDGVRVLVDSKALFSIIGSEMGWAEDELSAKFTFKNPNVKDACGCGESFNIENAFE